MTDTAWNGLETRAAHQTVAPKSSDTRVVISSTLSSATAQLADSTEAMLQFLRRSESVDLCEVNLSDAIAPVRSLLSRNNRAADTSGAFLVTVPSTTEARGAIGAIPASTLGLPVVAVHHSDTYLTSSSKHLRLFRRLCQPALEVVPSARMAELAAQSGNPDRVLIVDNSVFLADDMIAKLGGFPAPQTGASRPIILGFLGALTIEDGALDVLEAFARLADGGLAIELHIAGSMDDLEVSSTLLEITARHPHRVHHTEYPVDDVARCEWFNDIDIFVMPTRDLADAQPIVIYEAAAAGCAVLASDVGGIPQQLEAIGGYLISADDRLDSQIKRVMSMNAGIAGVRAGRERRVIRLQNHRQRNLASANAFLALLKDPAHL